MGSYVVKSDDIRNTIAQIEAAKPPHGTLDYRPALLDRLAEPDFRRIKWFFYCDDKQGNTIRVFDAAFLEAHGHLFSEKYVLLRGKNLGEQKLAGKVSAPSSVFLAKSVKSIHHRSRTIARPSVSIISTR